MAERPVLSITMGDPAGIGSEVIVKAHDEITSAADPLVIGDADVMRETVRRSDRDVSVTPVDEPDAARNAAGIAVLDLDNVDEIEYGVVNEGYGAASLAYVDRALELATAGDIDAIVTAPINKQATKLAGSEYAGHTGMIADYTDTDDYAMLLIEDGLRVSHVSTHVSLETACDLVTADQVVATAELTDSALRDLGVSDPRIAVAGLNPHASDGGLLGDTEATAIEPAVERLQDEGVDAVGPESPDTVFVDAARGDYDAVVAMYHDQGHIPVKMFGFDEGGVGGVNVTIGPPIVRTSVDHGTAFDIAGEGVASPKSLVDAAEVAVELAD